MARSKTTKRALVASACATLMCIAMLIGTTFAWFTDTASTSVNKIQSGNLDVALYYKDATGDWKSAEGENSLGWVQATNAEGTTTIVATDGLPLWEPGCTFTLPKLKIVNEGNLALKYKIAISGIQGNAKLLDAIEWTMKLDTTDEELGTEHSLAAKVTDAEESTYTDIFTISGHMKEDAGNEYQGLSIDGISITVYATQDTVEYDSTTKDYDTNAAYELKIDETATGNLPVTKSDGDANATVKTETTISSGSVSVTYPVNVKLVSDTEVTGTTDQKAAVEQELKYVSSAKEAVAEGVTVGDDQATASYTLTLPVADNNEVLVPVTINYNKGLTGVDVYHDGVLLATSAATPEREYAVYNKDTGVLILYLFHASPIDIVYDKPGTTTETTKVTTVDELKAAIAANGGKTIVLDNDLTLTNTYIAVNNNVTIDLNNHTITQNGETTFLIKTAVNFTVKNGKFVLTGTMPNAIVMGKGTYYNDAYESGDCNVVVKNVDFDVQGSSGSAIQAYTNTGMLTIIGGTYNVSSSQGSGLDIGNCKASITGITMNVDANNTHVDGIALSSSLEDNLVEIKNSTIKVNGNSSFWEGACLDMTGTNANLTNCKLIVEGTSGENKNIDISGSNSVKDSILNLRNCTITNNGNYNYGYGASAVYHNVSWQPYGTTVHVYGTNITATASFYTKGSNETGTNQFIVHSGSFSSVVPNENRNVVLAEGSTVTNDGSTWTVTAN